MKLLLLSNSTLPGEDFLAWPHQHLGKFLGGRKRIAFVPFAAVTFSMDDYANMVGKVLGGMGHELFSLHTEADPVQALDSADAIAVGGGNTFQLLRSLYQHDLVRAIRKKVVSGTPYIGWSAGSNCACPSIMTTNDMPITEPPSFRALDVVPFQINPHYTEATVAGHGGESRDQRIAEYLALHPRSTVLGLREGSLLHVKGKDMELAGKDMRVFRHGEEARDVKAGTPLRTDIKVGAIEGSH